MLYLQHTTNLQALTIATDGKMQGGVTMTLSSGGVTRNVSVSAQYATPNALLMVVTLPAMPSGEYEYMLKVGTQKVAQGVARVGSQPACIEGEYNGAAAHTITEYGG